MKNNSAKLYVQTDTGFAKLSDVGFNVYKTNSITSGGWTESTDQSFENEAIDGIKTTSKEGENGWLDAIGTGSTVTFKYSDGAINYISKFKVASKLKQNGKLYVQFTNTYEGTSKSATGGEGGGATEEYVDAAVAAEASLRIAADENLDTNKIGYASDTQHSGFKLGVDDKDEVYMEVE